MTSSRSATPDPSSFFRNYYGFVPRVFQAQAGLPEIVNTVAALAGSILGRGSLTQVEKECIVLATASLRQNVYCATLSYQTLSVLGVTEGELDRIMSGEGWSDGELTHEALLITAWADFVCSLAAGLGVAPDFEPVVIPPPGPARTLSVELSNRPAFPVESILEPEVLASLQAAAQESGGDGIPAKVASALAAFQSGGNIVHPPGPDSRHSDKSVPPDPDAELVAGVQRGDMNAFEALMERHGRRVYRTLLGVLGSADEARDAMQDTFLKAFQHISEFEGRSKFSTWLLSIANNTGVQRLREREPVQRVADDDPDEPFRPRELRAWTDNPEQLYAKAEMKALVEGTVMKLPSKYRVVVMLKDIEQLSTEEVAGALGLGVPAVKSRVLRGRLMMRETLAPHFASVARGGAA